ncbi:hypothetical protein B0H67DRAFT_639144 [Lasiosphaeris hirsuta]|uniref:Uncharacterized protein n=1 Tax=Lasiosphaeris hirsuta TaxID=260670 RepID=A0AA40ECU0_9PEZI|nr:hypothetical protein B0H67DRAFT_639144 [Lasiosphaeris hirsuta]
MGSSKPPHPPAVFNATTSSPVRGSRALVEQSKIVWDKTVASVHSDNATFGNTILPIIDDENIKLSRARLLRFYASTSPSKELRDASNAATKLLNDGEAELCSRADMFLHITSKSSAGSYVQTAVPPFDPVAKQVFENENKRIQELVRRCTSNVHKDSSGIWLSREELEGVPQDLITRLEKGDRQHEGKVWLKTKLPHPTKILSPAKSEATRKKVYYAIKNRLPEDVPLFPI